MDVHIRLAKMSFNREDVVCYYSFGPFKMPLGGRNCCCTVPFVKSHQECIDNDHPIHNFLAKGVVIISFPYVARTMDIHFLVFFLSRSSSATILTT